MYTHEIRTKEEPLWLYDFSPSFDIGNRNGVALAKDMEWLYAIAKRKGVPMEPISPQYVTKCFVYDEDFAVFEFEVTMRGGSFKRL